MFYKFEGKVYTSFDKLADAVMEAHPELLDDGMANFIAFSGEVEEAQYGFCPECGRAIDTEAYGNACSARCWRYLYGEVD